MEAIKLKKIKDSSVSLETLVVFDEIIIGSLTGNLFVPVFTGANIGFRFIPLRYLIANYMFPKLNGLIKCKMINFLIGYNKSLSELAQFYESDEIEIELIYLDPNLKAF